MVFLPHSVNMLNYTNWFVCFFKDFIYLTERAQAEGERERSRLPAEQGARCGTRSQDSGITTQAEGSRLTD